MKVIPLQKNPKQYTCNAYLVLGDWNKIDDVNTLIDIGMDDYILEEIRTINTGVGKKPIDQIILTHNHFDHSGGLKTLIQKYNPKIYSYDVFQDGVMKLKHGDVIRAGDRYLDVFHTDQHSSDSVCLICKHEGIVFTGDTPVQVNSTQGNYSRSFGDLIKVMLHMHINTIYPGHGPPIEGDIRTLLHQTLSNIRSHAVGVEKGGRT